MLLHRSAESRTERFHAVEVQPDGYGAAWSERAMIPLITKRCTFNIQVVQDRKKADRLYMAMLGQGISATERRCVIFMKNDARTEMYIRKGFSQKSHNPNFVSKLGL